MNGEDEAKGLDEDHQLWFWWVLTIGIVVWCWIASWGLSIIWRAITKVIS